MIYIKKIIDYVMDTLETIVFVGSIFIVIYIFIAFPTGVQGASMEPTLHTGDRLIISRINYKIQSPQRGDIVVVKSPINPDTEYIKRLIGLPGDKILIKEGKVYINDFLLEENYISAPTDIWDGGFIKEGESFIIPKDKIFIMGDNRNRSLDSRMFGLLSFSDIVGIAVFQYFPPNKIGSLLK